jgi:hypothetical protein
MAAVSDQVASSGQQSGSPERCNEGARKTGSEMKAGKKPRGLSAAVRLQFF